MEVYEVPYMYKPCGTSRGFVKPHTKPFGPILSIPYSAALQTL